MARLRLDNLMADRGLAPSRTAAATSIRAGLVRVGRGGERASKPSQLVAEDVAIEMEEGRRFASRGGLKLEAALEELALDVTGLDCLDVGASTGGFTDCLLQHGASRVIALDVGSGQLDWGLRNDDRVTVLEGVNARHLEPNGLPFEAALAVIDVSFISITKVLEPVSAAIADDGVVLAMVKPQFELGKGRVGKGGVVRSSEERREAVGMVVAAAVPLGFVMQGVAPAGVPGPKGNQEFFVQLGRDDLGGVEDPQRLIDEVVR